MPAKFGVVFLSKAVALPFLHFRMLRHGYLRCPIHWQEIRKVRRTPPALNPSQCERHAFTCLITATESQLTRVAQHGRHPAHSRPDPST